MEDFDDTPVPVNELNKWCGISYLEDRFKENVRLAFIFSKFISLNKSVFICNFNYVCIFVNFR